MISGQETITVGVVNQSIGSDDLFTAFNKTQNNFSRVFNAASPYVTFDAGAGINTVQSGTTVTITNTGIQSIIAGTGVTINNDLGNVTISASGNGGSGVTSVGLTSSTLDVASSPIISSGNIIVNLPPIELSEAFAPGEYIAPTLTVDEYGRINSIANTTSVGTVTSVAVAAVGDGLSITGGPITDSGTISITNTGVTRINAGSGIRLSGNTGNVTITAATIVTGTVTRVDISSTSLTILNSPITSSGTITIDIPDNIALVGNLISNTIVSNTTAVVTGNLTAGNIITGGKLTVTGNANIGNVGATTFVGNLSGAHNGTLGAGTPNTAVVTTLLAASANITANLTVGNIKSNASGNIVGNLVAGNISTAGDATVTGNILVGNITVNTDANIVGNIVGNLVAATFFISQGVTTGITANGVTLADATPLTKHLNIVSTVIDTANGIQLPNPIIGASVKVVNLSANTVHVFPTANAAINILSANASYTMVSNARVEFCASGTAHWYTFP